MAKNDMRPPSIHLYGITDNLICMAVVFFRECNLLAFAENYLLIHANEKPYVREICNKDFIRYKTLKTHLSIYTKEKRYAYDVCNRTFSQNSTFREHLRVHTNYSRTSIIM
ncbi:UNVERIFIED_CONTAM: zinc finger protein [Trichonephila clavipes]